MNSFIMKGPLEKSRLWENAKWLYKLNYLMGRFTLFYGQFIHKKRDFEIFYSKITFNRVLWNLFLGKVDLKNVPKSRQKWIKKLIKLIISYQFLKGSLNFYS
jgi:hypothetical protein